jgi:hypothetical protein
VQRDYPEWVHAVNQAAVIGALVPPFGVGAP